MRDAPPDEPVSECPTSGWGTKLEVEDTSKDWNTGIEVEESVEWETRIELSTDVEEQQEPTEEGEASTP